MGPSGDEGAAPVTGVDGVAVVLEPGRAVCVTVASP